LRVSRGFPRRKLCLAAGPGPACQRKARQDKDLRRRGPGGRRRRAAEGTGAERNRRGRCRARRRAQVVHLRALTKSRPADALRSAAGLTWAGLRAPGKPVSSAR
jgi:hypothetical protein